MGGAHLHSLSESGAEEGQEHARYAHVIARLGQARVLPPSVYGHAARDVPHRHLVALRQEQRENV